MNIMVFDTSVKALAAGVTTDKGLFDAHVEAGFKHSETLLPSIEACLAKAGIGRHDIELIACTSGPGSFTGLRIGMATAKGLSLALGIPWIGVPTLDCMAFGHDPFPGPVVPVIDARKNRIYSALYFHGIRGTDYLDIGLSGLITMLDSYGEALFVGPDADLLADYLLERPGFVIENDDPSQRLLGLATLAQVRYEQQGPDPDDAGPLYIREPEIG